MPITIPIQIQMPAFLGIPMESLERNISQIAQRYVDSVSQAPCRFSVDEVRQMGMQALTDAQQGKGLAHEDVKQIAASWRR